MYLCALMKRSLSQTLYRFNAIVADQRSDGHVTGVFQQTEPFTRR